MKTWHKRTSEQNKGDVRERVTLIYNCKTLPASSIFTKIEHSKDQFIRETLKHAGRKLLSDCVSKSILILDRGKQMTSQAAHCPRSHAPLSVFPQSLPAVDIKMMAEK